MIPWIQKFSLTKWVLLDMDKRAPAGCGYIAAACRSFLQTFSRCGKGGLYFRPKENYADGYVIEYPCNVLDMVTHINYNGGKEVSYQYNAVGDLVQMDDWTGINTFEVDLLHRITEVTDHKGNKVTYEYDATGNQTKVGYPDGTSVTKTYDLVGNLESVVESDGRTTTYQYDGMGRVVHMNYPDGWQEDYTYDAIGQLLAIDDTDPTQKDMKQQKNRFEYDACGNMTYEYMRGNGTGEATVEVFYTYDELHQVTHAQEDYGNKSRSYQYDSLGNLTLESNSNNVTVDYKLNNLNQITTSSDDGWKTSTAYSYDKRGNLTQELYTKGKKQSVTGAYTFDETNKMVKGVNDLGESSEYLYNGLGALVTNTWTIKKNAYGYHDVSALVEDAMVDGEIVEDKQTGKKEKKDKKDPEVVSADANLNKTSTVVKNFVIDYTVETMNPLYETESTDDGLDYRYVYGLNGVRLSVTVKGVPNGAGHIIENGDEIRLYYHQDLRGTVDYLTSPVSGKVESWTHYNEWGEITHNAVLKCGQRELDLVKNYTGHEYDAVLGMYYAKARFYDSELRRFTSVDPVKGFVIDPISMVQYLYVKNRPLTFIDPLGEYLIKMNTATNPITYDVILENVGQSVLEDIFTNYVSGAEWIIAVYQKNSGIVGGNGKKATLYETILDIINALDSSVGTVSSLVILGSKIEEIPLDKNAIPKGLEDLIDKGLDQVMVVLEGTGKSIKQAGTKIVSSLKTVGSVAFKALGIYNFMSFMSGFDRFSKDDVLFDLMSKVALDNKKYTNYLTGWTNPDKLEAMMEDALSYITSSSSIYNMKEGGGPNFRVSNYFYFFNCITGFVRRHGNSVYHENWSNAAGVPTLPKSLWQYDRLILHNGSKQYGNMIREYAAIYEEVLNPKYYQ